MKFRLDPPLNGIYQRQVGNRKLCPSHVIITIGFSIIFTGFFCFLFDNWNCFSNPDFFFLSHECKSLTFKDVLKLTRLCYLKSEVTQTQSPPLTSTLLWGLQHLERFLLNIFEMFFIDLNPEAIFPKLFWLIILGISGREKSRK